MLQADPPIILTVGIMLSAAMILGRLAFMMHLPSVTAYLAVGLFFSPHTLELIPEAAHNFAPTALLMAIQKSVGEHLHDLHPLGNLAMALVLFNMGCHFTFVHFRRILTRVTRVSAGELICTFGLVTVGLFLLGVSLKIAALFGILALATAPATTILVLKESESEGPITEYSMALLAINNLVAIVLFECLFVAVQANSGSLQNSLPSEYARLFGNLAAALSLGALAGLLTSYNCALFARERWLVVLIAITTIVLGLCELFDFPYLLAFLAMGVTVANASDRAEEVVDELDRMTGLLCVVFFAIHGAELDLPALLSAGAIGVGYIFFRTAGKYAGIYFTADNHRDGPLVREWLGAAMLSQAGAAIALCAVAKSRDPTLGDQLQPIILGSVVFFELVGPVFARQAVLRAGETPLDRAFPHNTTTAWEELRNLVNRLLISMGRDPWAKLSPDKLTIGQLMRSNIKGIPAQANFDDLAHWIEHSHENTFPVVSEDGRFVGIIRYDDVRDNVFDPELGNLVFAEDLAVPPPVVMHANSPLVSALEHFRRGNHDAIPVVEPEEPHRYVGLVRRKDLIRFIRRGRQPELSNRSSH